LLRVTPRQTGGINVIKRGCIMPHFKRYLLHGYNPEDTDISVLFDSLDEAIKKGQLWAEQDHYGRLHIAIYQLVEVIKEEPTNQEKVQIGQACSGKSLT
jgi:hypothetical protein